MATTTTASVKTHPVRTRPVSVPAWVLGELLREAIDDPFDLIMPARPGRGFWGEPDDGGVSIVDDTPESNRVGFITWPALSEIIDTIRSARCHAVW